MSDLVTLIQGVYNDKDAAKSLTGYHKYPFGILRC